MDHRTPLKLHTVLAFEGMSCHIEEVIGQGSNAIVYKGWYQDSLNRELRHHVLVKELFPFHPQKKIYRAEDCHIVIEPEAEELWETHKKSFEIGNQVHLRLLHDHPDMMVMGTNLNSFQFNGTLYSVLGYTGGRSLQTELNKTNVSLRYTAQRMIGLLDALEAFHKSGYLHLDISPDNIMLVGQEEQERIFLIDYNSAREAGSRDSSYLSCKAGYSAPEVSTGNLGAMGFASDLYSVAAVFFRCIMGRSLTLAEMLQPKAPDCQDSPLLKDMPQTVSAMVGSILKKGLHTLSRRRYQSIGQMRQAFQELQDRIDCVGVTHWSLWENGKRSVEELIKINPSLRYLKDEKKLYPIRLEQEYSMSLERYLDNLLSPEGKSGIILAQGGMGKTTLLLHTAMLQGKRYSAATPAVFYISLNGWEKADTKYIRSQILMRLRFKKEENTFDSAMHALHKLLEQPIKTKQGNVPTVLLLLDGLNEVCGDIAPLVQEINELGKMGGVRILATSRSEVPELGLESAGLMPLNVEDIEEALGRNGLLIPQKQDIIQLLRTPLILSIYIQASENGRQLNVRNEDELMKAYMDSLLEKEIQQLPEESPHRWQIDVALNYVLPAIAAEVKKKGHALTEREMLKVVENCWKVLRSRYTLKALPDRWIGRKKDILGESKNAEDWYDQILHHLLWKRLGLLIKNQDNQYRIFHQLVEQHLDEDYFDVSQKILKRQRRVAVFCTVAYAVFLICIGAFSEWEEYVGDMEIDLWYSFGQHKNHYESVLLPTFQDVIDAAEAYVQEPNEQSVKIAHTATKNAAMKISDSISWWDFYDESSKRFDSETERMQFSSFEKKIMESMNKPVDHLVYLEKDYLSQKDSTEKSFQKFDDCFELLFTLDALIAFHQNNESALPLVLDYVSAMSKFVDVRGEMLELLYTGNHFDTTDPDWSELARMDSEMESLADVLISISQELPLDRQYAKDERVLTFLNKGLWQDYSTDSFPLLPIPQGWEVPAWMPADADTFYLITDDTSEEIRIVRDESDIIPFAWCAVCPNVLKEDVLSYMEKVITQSGPYWYNNQEDYFQAIIQLESVSVNIVWTTEKTELIITGALY